jgi:hypothetical protein
MILGVGAGRTGSLLLLLAIASGGVGWNYARNVQAEQAVPRPFRSYAESDLGALAEAYQAELEALSKPGQRPAAAPASSGTFLGERLQAFEQVQRQSRASRQRRSAALDREVTLELIRAEQAMRERERDRLGLFLRRAFVYRP